MTLNEVLKPFRDPYDRKARAFPALLVVLPLLVPLIWIFGPKNPYITALSTLIGSCGVLYWLASIARNLGKALEEKLVAKWGGMPSTLMLRHADGFLDSHSTDRYHAGIKAKLGITLPTKAEELQDPAAADDKYVGATRLLRERTRGKGFDLLLKENIAYGFHRNMLAMKPIGICACVVGIAIGLVLLRVIVLKPLAFDISNLGEPNAAGGITLAVGVGILIAWLSMTEGAVRRIANVYAERLFESLNTLTTKKSASPKA